MIFVLIDILIAYLCYCATQLIFDAGANDFSSMISNCSYYAVEKCIQNDFDFSSVCQVEKDANGSITFIQTNTLLVDYFAKQLALDCYNYFDSYLKQGFNVPIGVFSGIEILAGFGRKVNIKLITTGSVECQFLRTFESAGINQTRQTLTAILHTDLTVYTLFQSRKFSDDIEIIVYDNLVVGKVPDTYLNSQIIGSSQKS